MNTFGNFFGTYIDCSNLPEHLLSGELKQLQINAKERGITAEVALDGIVIRKVLYDAEKRISTCKQLNLSRAQILPKYDSNLFSIDYLFLVNC